MEAKAGIVGAMYALERLFAASGKAGTDLTNFNAVTGNSVKMLQQYQYAARQVGVSNQDVEGSFKALQSTMTKTALGLSGRPAGLALVSTKLQQAGLGGISQEDIQKFAAHPELLLQKLQTYAQLEKNLGVRNEALRSFGLNDNMVAAVSRNAFRADVLNRAPTYSNQEVSQLDKANIAWSNLGNKIAMAVGHFNAQHGGKLVTDISKIIDQVIRLTEAFVKLSDRLKLFEGVGKVFEGWTKIFSSVNGAVDQLSDPKQRKNMLSNTLETGKNVGGFLTSLGPEGFLRSSFKSLTEAVAPTPPKGGVAPAKQQNNHVNIHNTFSHPGVDPKKTGDSMKQSINQAYRQMSPQTQGT